MGMAGFDESMSQIACLGSLASRVHQLAGQEGNRETSLDGGRHRWRGTAVCGSFLGAGYFSNDTKLIGYWPVRAHLVHARD